MTTGSVLVLHNRSGSGGTYIGKGFTAAVMVANMRLLARMGPQVDRQSAALDKAFIAIFHGATIRPFIGVYSMMSDEI